MTKKDTVGWSKLFISFRSITKKHYFSET